MDIQEKEVLIAEIERFKEEAMKSYVVSCWAESYTNTDPFGYVVLENENNKVWWLKTQAYELWCFWQAAKAQAVPEGFVLVKVSDIAKLAIAVSRVDLMTYSEERPDSEKLAWQNVANKLEAMIESQEQKG